jgi:hypothetical protein
MTNNKKLFFIILVLSLVGLGLRILFLWKYSTAFTYDQGRDLLEIREMVVLKKPRLIGANTSLHGVFFGPLWYYLALPFYVISQGHPLSTICPLFILVFSLPLVIFWIFSDKKLGFLLALVYVSSNTFFNHSLVALNTNPVVFIVPIILVPLAKFFVGENNYFFWLAMFLAGVCFHFEVISSIFWLPIFFISSFFLKKLRLVVKNWPAIFAFIFPFTPQILFDIRHHFIQTKALLSLFLGKGSSLTPTSGGLVSRLFDRARIFKDVFIESSGGGFFLALIFAFLVTFLISLLPRFRKKAKKDEFYYLIFITLFSLTTIFIGFVLYPFALWSWYLGVIDALLVTLIGLELFFFLGKGRKLFYLSLGLLLIWIWSQIHQHFFWPWPLTQEFSTDPANLATRLLVIDLIYKDANGKGMKIYTFAPYVYDYPYQYLIWWRAKTKYKYLPEDYFYLPSQPQYIPAKIKADQLIPTKKAEANYLVIEPFESQKEWFDSWRNNFPVAKKDWTVGRTRIEKLELL